MFIVIPPHKQIRMMGNAGGTVQAWDTDDTEGVTQPDGSPIPPIEFQFVRDFVRRVLLNDSSWGKSMEQLYCAMDLRTTFLKAAPGDVVELTKAQHDALVNVLKSPSVPYNTSIAILLGDFFKAIEEASSKAPAPLQ